jgi:hypothetical protein
LEASLLFLYDCEYQGCGSYLTTIGYSDLQSVFTTDKVAQAEFVDVSPVISGINVTTIETYAKFVVSSDDEIGVA